MQTFGCLTVSFLFAIIFSNLSCAVAGTQPSSGATENSDLLKVSESFKLNIPEISGMCWRTDPQSKRKQLVVVSDSEYAIYLLDWENRRSENSLVRIDVKNLFSNLNENGSQWESVASDKLGRIYILQESPGTIYVLSADLTKLSHEISLEIDSSFPHAKDWNSNSNSRGEGIILLENGHVMVLKEKEPTLVIEFGPRQKQPVGLRPQSAIDETKAFLLPDGTKSKFFPLKQWNLRAADTSILADASGLNVGTDGRLFLLSAKSRKIVEVSNELALNQGFLKIVKSWELPADIKTAEGMVFSEKNIPILGIDAKEKKKKKVLDANIFVMSSLAE